MIKEPIFLEPVFKEMIWGGNRMREDLDKQQEVIDAQKEDLSRQQEDLDKQQEVIDAQKKDLSRQQEDLDKQREVIDAQQKQIEELKARLAEK